MKSPMLLADVHVYQKWLTISPAHFCKSRQLFSCLANIYMLNKPVKLFQPTLAIKRVVKIELKKKTTCKMRVDIHIVPL